MQGLPAGLAMPGFRARKACGSVGGGAEDGLEEICFPRAERLHGAGGAIGFRRFGAARPVLEEEPIDSGGGEAGARDELFDGLVSGGADEFFLGLGEEFAGDEFFPQGRRLR